MQFTPSDSFRLLHVAHNKFHRFDAYENVIKNANYSKMHKILSAQPECW